MKNKLLAALFLMGLSATVANATPTATPGQGVKNSVHDMSASAGATDGGNNGRICAFCHTPHHAVDMSDQYAPLWSRNNSNATTSYASYLSTTFDTTLTGISDPAIGPTRLCMSCHDGSIAPDQHYGQVGASPLLTNDNFGGAGVGASNKLSNDHPIGFDYFIVAQGAPSGLNSDVTPGSTTESMTSKKFIRSLGPTGAELIYINNSLNITVKERLFNGTIMTCATCHDVHNKKNVVIGETATFNYLVLAPQNGSALCLTCHIK